MDIENVIKPDRLVFLVCGKIGMGSKFDKWLHKEKFKCWQIKGYYCIDPNENTWDFIDINSKTFAPAIPGIKVAEAIGNHAITIKEFKQIYHIYKKYEGKDLFVFKNERFDYD